MGIIRRLLPAAFKPKPKPRGAKTYDDLRRERLAYIHRDPDLVTPEAATAGLRGVLGGHPHFHGSTIRDKDRMFPKHLERNKKIVNAGIAVQMFCMNCQCAATPQEEVERVLNCDMTECPLWAFRTGEDPLGRS